MDGMDFIPLNWPLPHWVAGVDGDATLVIFVPAHLNVAFPWTCSVEDEGSIVVVILRPI